MLEFFSFISTWLSITILVATGVTFFYFYKLTKKLALQKGTIQKKDIASKVFPFILFFIFILMIMKLMSYVAFYDTKELLKESDTRVIVNGVILEMQQQAVFALDLNNYSGSKGESGSSPILEIEVIIKGKSKQLVFHFKRDSKDKNLYWVFFRGYPSRPEIGFVRTSVLAGF